MSTQSTSSDAETKLYDPEVINVYENFWSVFGYIKSILIGCILIPIRGILWVIFFLLYLLFLFCVIWFLPEGGLIFSSYLSSTTLFR